MMKVNESIQREMTYDEMKTMFFNLSVEISCMLGDSSLHDNFLKHYDRMLEREKEVNIFGDMSFEDHMEICRNSLHG